jgi:hypothetical protein
MVTHNARHNLLLGIGEIQAAAAAVEQGGCALDDKVE